jgi:hypothetical protein
MRSGKPILKPALDSQSFLRTSEAFDRAAAQAAELGISLDELRHLLTYGEKPRGSNLTPPKKKRKK